MLYEKIVELIGPPPSGFEPVLYVACVLVLLWLLSTFFSVLWSFLQMLGGGRRG